MKNLKVVKIDSESIEFENGVKLYSDHQSDCCESHYLSFADLELRDFDKLEFDLTGDKFFKKIEDYGIELVPIKGWGVKIPGYGYNNGYYSTELTLCIIGEGLSKEFDITECQVIED
tara:strand:- start:10714 stop:11064 length:351 start_codon:yes stop_codon:yes gene_type:complete